MKKMLGIILSLILTMSLMVGCSDTEEFDNGEQNNQFEEPQNDVSRAYALIKYAIQHTTDENDGVGPFNDYADVNVIENDNDVTIEIQATDKLDEVAIDFSAEDWNKCMIEPSLQLSDIIYEELSNENIDIELNIDIITSDRSIVITKITRGQIVENNFDQYVNKILKEHLNSENKDYNQERRIETNGTEQKVEEQEEPERVNSKFYIGNDGCYHCLECNQIPSKAEYNENMCDNCANGGEKIEQCYHCYTYITPGMEYEINGLIYCPDCARDMGY